MQKHKNRIALIGGTGLNQLPDLRIAAEETVETPYGEPSGPLARGTLNGADVIFLARHGPGHVIPPHRINYRANLWALSEQGASAVLSVAAVGGITEPMVPGRIAVPDQIVDYTWGREHTYYDGGDSGVEHIDFTRPYSEGLRRALLHSSREAGIEAIDHGVYGATQGPRLESAAEIRKLEKDGCDLVGMTGMPEAALARELGLEYAGISAIVNRAAGKGSEAIHADMESFVDQAMEQVHRLTRAVAAYLHDVRGIMYAGTS